MKRRFFYKLLRHLWYVDITAAWLKYGEKDDTYNIHEHDDRQDYPDSLPNSPCPAIFYRQLLIYPRQLLGNIACGLLILDLLAQQLADGHLEYLRKPYQRSRIRHRLPLLPLGHCLPDHMKSGGKLLLREALLLSECFQIFTEHSVSRSFALMPPRYHTRRAPASNCG